MSVNSCERRNGGHNIVAASRYIGNRAKGRYENVKGRVVILGLFRENVLLLFQPNLERDLQPPPPFPTALALTPRRASCVVNLHRLVQLRFRKPCSSVLECIVLLKNKWQKEAV